MQNLLDKIGVINSKYSILEEKDKFNFFEILRKESDEVHLHSRFIYELLKKNGQHQLGDIFAQEFLEIIGIPDFDLSDYSVHKEDKDINIFIRNQSQAIIIENKIWEEGQTKQLGRYYDIINKEGYTKIYVYYLTLNGGEPCTDSLEKLKLKGGGKAYESVNEQKNDESKDESSTEIVELISFKYDINNWLEKCTEKASKKADVRETIIQYQKLFNKLTGNPVNSEKLEEIYGLLSENHKEMEYALTIVENWHLIKSRIEWDFWIAFEKIINSKKIYKVEKYEPFQISKKQKYTPYELHENNFTDIMDIDFSFGLSFKIGEYKGQDLYIVIARSYGEPYWGITTYGDNQEDDENLKSEIYNKIKHFCPNEKNSIKPVWVISLYFHPYIDFENFTKYARNTINSERRNIVINECWAQIETLIKQTINILEM